MFNAGSPNSVSGLRVDADGGLAPLAGSTRPLSAAASGPAQIEFSRDGRALLVTEKATSRIDSYSIGPDGLAGAASVRPSAGATPFGFAFDQRGHLIVSDAFGGAPGAGALSSYELAADGSLATITGVAGDGQAAPCWVVTTSGGRYAYTTNTGSGNVSSYSIGTDGSLQLLASDAGTTGAGPIDMALSQNDRFLYTLDAGSHSVRRLRRRRGRQPRADRRPVGSSRQRRRLAAS